VIYLSGAVRSDLPPEVGVIVGPRQGNLIPPDRQWAFDNGCFRDPDAFDRDRWLAELVTRGGHDRCLFAVAPDVVGDAVETLRRSLPVLPLIRAIGVPAALVAQDGLEALPVPWDAFDCLFVGGSTAWKLSEAAYALAAEAKRRGKHTHMGRVNSLRRLRAAMVGGYDSADGTFLTFGPNVNLPRVRAWLDALNRQPALWEVA